MIQIALIRVFGIEPTVMKFTWTSTAKLTKVSCKTTGTDTEVAVYTYSMIGTTIRTPTN